MKSILSSALVLFVGLALGYGTSQATASAPPATAAMCEVTFSGACNQGNQDSRCQAYCDQHWPNGGLHTCFSTADCQACCTCAH